MVPDHCGIEYYVTSCGLRSYWNGGTSYDSSTDSYYYVAPYCYSTVYSNSYVTMSVDSPWPITLSRAVLAGYTLSFCIVCTNSGG